MVKDHKHTISAIRSELSKYIKTSGVKSLVLGISGGVDSALCAALVKPVCDDNGIQLIGRSLVMGNSPEEVHRAKLVGEAFCHNFKEVNTLSTHFHSMWSELSEQEGNGDKDPFRRGNVKARIRMIYLYDVAQHNNGMVLSTDNWTEYLLGFWTLHGDVGDFGPIQSLWKTEVYSIAEWLVENELLGRSAIALSECIHCHATDGLGITKTDLDQILPGWSGTSRDGYAEVDKELMDIQMGKMFNISSPVVKRFFTSSYKRTNPYNINREKIVKHDE